MLFPYQEVGVQWLLGRETSGTPYGGFLCDEMGLGKTVQLAELFRRNRLGSTLIIVPKSIVGQWRSELERFAPELSVHVFDGPKRVWSQAEVTVVPYSLVDQIPAQTWDRIVLDEGHEIRNPKSKGYRLLKGISANVRWVVTGTPIFNSMKDFVSLCSFVGLTRGDVLRDYDKVRQKYVLRRTKESKSVMDTVELDMYPEEQQLYTKAFQYGQGLIDSTDNAIIMLEGILRLRQVMTWPQLFTDGLAIKENTDPELYTGRSKKHEVLMDSIESHPDEKALVFTQFTVETDRIQEMLTERGIPTFRIDGHVTDKEERETRIEQFRRAPANAVFLIQIRAGGVGLNLQEASRVYITSPAWNPATELQAIGRADRTGQKRKVHVTRMVYRTFPGVNSIEEFMMDLHDKKSNIVADILGGQKKGGSSDLTMRTIAKIFSV